MQTERVRNIRVSLARTENNKEKNPLFTDIGNLNTFAGLSGLLLEASVHQDLGKILNSAFISLIIYGVYAACVSDT